MRLFRALVLLSTLLAPAAAVAAERLALVVGMASYGSIPALKNTANDARLIAETLERIGFEVTIVIDAPQHRFLTELARFSFSAETADIALIYFAGHGVELRGENLLIPVDANVRTEEDIRLQSVSLGDLLTAVDRSRKLRIVILDSCRDNPFANLMPQAADTAAQVTGGAAGRGAGLAPPSPERGTLVAFAARDGSVALDGQGQNSPFALSLAQKLAEPGLEISLMFRQIRDAVLTATANRQEPQTYGSLSGVPFYLAGEPAEIEQLSAPDPREAWAALRPDSVVQLAALAETGDTRSLLGLAYLRLNPDAPGFDPSEAARLLARAAEAGAPDAQFELGKLYEQGIGVPQDTARALDLFHASAAQNYADALNDLGFLHYQGGLGIPRDTTAALGYFERAADQRHPQAMFNFAALIDDGLVPGKGPEQAGSYLYDALRSGSTDVLTLLSERPTMFKDATRRALQARLRDVELYAGSIDGNFGPGTIRGLRRAYGLAE